MKCGLQDLNRPRGDACGWWWWRATIGIVFKSFLASIFDIFIFVFCFLCVCTGRYCTLSISPLSHIRARRIECQMSSIVAVTQCQLPSISSSIFSFLPFFILLSFYFFIIWFFTSCPHTKVNLTVQHLIVNPSNGFNTKMLAQGFFIAVRFFAVHVEVYQHGSTER